MSVSKWRWTEDCDYGICVGDCDKCDKAIFEEETEETRNEQKGGRDDTPIRHIRKRLG